MDALLAFGAALLSLRLSGDLARRFRARRAPELAAWSAGLAAYAAAAGALAWGAAAGWNEAAFRVYYLGGGLLTAALLGAGSALLVGRRWVAPVALVYVGLAVGLALAVPLQGAISGTEVPEAQEVLDLWPARVTAILANSLGTLAVVVVAVLTFKTGRWEMRSSWRASQWRASAAVSRGSASVRSHRRSPWPRCSSTRASSPARRLVVSRDALAVETALAEPDPHQDPDDGERDERLDDRAGHAAVGH